MQGTVCGYTYGYSSLVKVMVDGLKTMNTYNENSLKLINKNDKGDYEMTGNFKVAGIKFEDGSNQNSTYYYALYSDDIKVGDTVVVQTGHHGLSVAHIVNINDNGSNKVQYGREIIDKVNMDAFKLRKENRAKVAKLKGLMEQRVKELQDITLFEMMAEKDDSLKTMLDEYKNLIG